MNQRGTEDEASEAGRSFKPGVRKPLKIFEQGFDLVCQIRGVKSEVYHELPQGSWQERGYPHQLGLEKQGQETKGPVPWNSAEQRVKSFSGCF